MWRVIKLLQSFLAVCRCTTCTRAGTCCL